MPIANLFSKRQKSLRGEVPDVYQYDKLPKPLRIQIIQILRDAFGIDKEKYNYPDRPRDYYKYIHETVCHEYGVFTIGKGNYSQSDEGCVQSFILEEEDIEKVLDVVELSFKVIIICIKENYDEYTYNTTIKIKPDEAIAELNDRFKEHGFGYQFSNGEIFRVDSTYIHSEVVIPTLRLLSNRKFKGANDEYLSAHEHYRHGKNKECLTDCLKAFESTMKIICKEKGWTYNQNDTSKKLIEICFQNNLVPSFTQNQFTSLRSLLESGIPTIRNKLGGHGQGQIPQRVDDEMTRYALNLTGTNILFLIEQSQL